VIVEGETALARPVGDVEGLAEDLDRLLASVPERARLGAGGRRRIQSVFAWEGIMDRLMDALERFGRRSPSRTASRREDTHQPAGHPVR
jgi:glycosyltransferase involved in cell wall biosynthesis